LIAALALCFLVAGLWYASRTRASTGTGPRHALAPAKLSESISVHAAGRGNPAINFSDGREVVSDYEGPAGLRVALQQNLAQPLSLAAADFDEDGVPDLIGGYKAAGHGIVSLWRGNVDSIYPNAPEAQQRRADHVFSESPFLSPAQLFELPEA